MDAKKSPLDIPNAFVGRAGKPTAEEVNAVLGASAKVWTELVDELAAKYAVPLQEWKSSSPKYGWSLRLLRKKRTIVYLSPCEGCFRVAFILGDKAVKALRHGKLSQSLAELIDEAPRYPEGTGVRLIVRGTKEMAAIRKLVEAKLAN